MSRAVGLLLSHQRKFDLRVLSDIARVVTDEGTRTFVYTEVIVDYRNETDQCEQEYLLDVLKTMKDQWGWGHFRVQKLIEAYIDGREAGKSFLEKVLGQTSH